MSVSLEPKKEYDIITLSTGALRGTGAVPAVVIGVMYPSLSKRRNSAEQPKTILLTNAVQQW